MAHGKETPRQKMIGMMYLVLTALLALNVSAEVLNAFVLIDESLTQNAKNFQRKNNDIYVEFEQAYQENPGKVEEWRTKALDVQKKSQEMFDYMKDLKEEIVSIADGSADDYHHHGPIAVKKKDDNNVPGEVMVTKQRGLELKEKINQFEAELLTLIDDTAKYNKIVHSIQAGLNTKDMEAHGEGKKVPWEIGMFEHIPLSGVLTMLSKLQTDVRNAEAEMLGYLFRQIDAGAFKFNKIEAIVKAPTNYVTVGGKYTAEVFIAASDTTVTPEIALSTGQELEIKDGKGVWNGPTSSVGIKKWGGVIRLLNPATEDTVEYPFQSEYQVAEPSLVVSPTKMNVFYIGVKNPVNIAVSGIPDNKINAIISEGSITRDPAEGWVVKVRKPTPRNKLNYISVTADIDGSVKDMGRKGFRVKKVPDPVATVANMEGGVIKKNVLLAQSGVKAILKDFDFELEFRVTSFVLSASIGGYNEEAKSNSNMITPQQRDLLKKVRSGKKVYFESIVAKGQDGSTRKLPTITFRVQ